MRVGGVQPASVLLGLYVAGVVALTLLGFAAIGVGDHDGPHDVWFKLTLLASAMTAVGAAAAARGSRWAAALLYFTQFVCLVLATRVDSGSGGVRVAPAVVTVGVIAEAVGAFALWRRSMQS